MNMSLANEIINRHRASGFDKYTHCLRPIKSYMISINLVPPTAREMPPTARRIYIAVEVHTYIYFMFSIESIIILKVETFQHRGQEYSVWNDQTFDRREDISNPEFRGEGKGL